MAIIDFQITIADIDVPRVQAAARATFGAGLSDAEIIEILRKEVVARLITMVVRVERENAMTMPIVVGIT